MFNHFFNITLVYTTPIKQPNLVTLVCVLVTCVLIHFIAVCVGVKLLFGSLIQKKSVGPIKGRNNHFLMGTLVNSTDVEEHGVIASQSM